MMFGLVVEMHYLLLKGKGSMNVFSALFASLFIQWPYAYGFLDK